MQVIVLGRAVPVNVTVNNVMQTQFDVSYQQIFGALSYTAYAVPLNSSFETKNSTDTAITQTISDLQPGLVYNVTVGATYQTGDGEVSVVVQQVTGRLAIQYKIHETLCN